MSTIENINKVAIIGAGTMGQGIAQVFAQAGIDVAMYDAVAGAADKALERIGGQLARAVEKGKLTADQRTKTLAKIKAVPQIRDVGPVPLAIEAVSEQVEVKKAVFKALEETIAPDAILASNTSSISITVLAASTRRAHRFIGMHFFNPVPVMTLVEVVTGLQTDEATTQTIVELSKKLGKTPLRVKDHPGFVSNRVLMPLINEAIYALLEGIADAATIDGVMKMGCNHPMGPLALADLIGLDVCLHIMEVLHRELGIDRFAPCPLLRTMVAAGRLGRKTKKGFFDYE